MDDMAVHCITSLRNNGYYEILVESDNYSLDILEWCNDKFGHNNYMSAKTSFFFDNKENAAMFKLVWG